MNYAVIMAGGTGKRLWPLSRRRRPKQVLKLLDGHTLLGRCLERLIPVFDARNILALTNVEYADQVRENLPDLPFNNVIAEPVVRDTAGAIALAATILAKYDPDAVMALLTADQLIEPPDALQQALTDAFTFLSGHPEALVTFGIKPTFPSTQLGYIKYGGLRKCPQCRNKVYAVEAFKEKPDQETARQYIESGAYSWNSGMFVWRAKAILANLQKFLPEAVEPLRRIGADWDTPAQEKTLQEWFPRLPKISIDYAVMEKADQVHAIGLDCQWLDMGSFAALADVIKSDENNNIVVAGASELLDCRNDIVVTEEKGHLIAAIGLEDIVIAHTPDATLVCHVSQTERIKALLDQMEQHGRTKYL
jgi:mannose-1-phosphate guanylyltransferase